MISIGVIENVTCMTYAMGLSYLTTILKYKKIFLKTPKT